MGATHPQPQPVTNEVLAFQIGQVQESLRQVLDRLAETASKSDMADLQNRVRVLEDERVRARTLFAVGGFLGLGGVGAILKWVLSA